MELVNSFDVSNIVNSPLLMLIVLWELIWKGFGLWRAGRKNEPWWFFAIFILNTIGILPIIYLIISQDKKKKIERIVSKKKIPKKK
jgi:hypothetical protein